MLIDTHSHLNFKDFNKDRWEIIEKCLKNDVWLINASSNFNTSKLAVEIAEKYPKGIYAAIALHPIHADEEDFDFSNYKILAESNKVKAIGETGLDFLYGAREKQKKVFLKHIELARDTNLPIIFHCRKAHNEMLEILRKLREPIKGVVHCFTGKWRQAEQYLDMGLYLGFNGIIYKMNLDKIIKRMPLDRIFVETDSPYLTPLPAISSTGSGVDNKKVRNEPLNVKYIIQRIADLRGEPFEKIADATTKNAKQLFKI